MTSDNRYCGQAVYVGGCVGEREKQIPNIY